MGFNTFLKIIGAQNQLPITFCLDLMRNKTLRLEIRPPHTRVSNLLYPYCELNPNKK